MAAKFFALVALLAVGARASPVFDHSNMENADNTEAEFLEQVLNNQVEESIAAFDMLRRSNTSNTTGTGGNTGGGGATPVAVPAVDNSLTGTTQKVQVITLSGITAADFNSNTALKTAIEIGYSTHIGLYANGAYVNGASCEASVQRRALAVTMTTTVPNSHLAAVTAHQTNLANDAGGTALSNLASAIATAMSNQNVTGVTITVASASAATTSPTPSPATTSGASQTAILSVSAIAALVLALRH